MEKIKTYCGLTEEEVLESRAKHGANILSPPKRKSLWLEFFEKFQDPIIRILLFALLLTIGVAFYHYYTDTPSLSVFLEPLGILLAVLLATCVGFALEVSANKKFDILNQINDEIAVKVIRNKKICEISRKDVVVGDILVLGTGEEVPADGILLEATSLQINESTLTGEPVIQKTIKEEEFDPEATYPSNVLLKGSNVIDGHGMMCVQKVGDASEYGKVYEGSQIERHIETPLNQQLKRLSKLISYAGYSIAALIIIARLSIYFQGIQDLNWIEAASYILNTFMLAVSIIVVSVPEGLPMSVTLSLALSMKRMLSTNNLVRKMHACETMGAATVICTDKTGTLTQNQMEVYKTNFYGLAGADLSENLVSQLIKEGIAINSTAFLDYSDPLKVKALGNPTEAALLLWLHKKGENYLSLRESGQIIEQLTFSTERKYMATLVYSSLLQKKVLYVKGAPEIVFSLCSEVQGEKGGIETSEYKELIAKQLQEYQNQAMRTLGFAYCIIEDDQAVFYNGKLSRDKLSFIGIAAISDPVREDVPQAVKSCLDAGIQVKIVTGDTPGTAKEIGRQIGLWTSNDTDKNHMTGVEFAEMPDKELSQRIMELKILSRARPMDKERLVRLLQEQDQVVAVTGDGTNDAPALNAAQVGLSMGDGTSVAKEASAITILDNSFLSITRAVMWGRSLYQNIQRFILFQLSINIVACVIVLIGAFLGTESPLSVTQMLWVNLIMDTFAAIALASLPPNPELMKDKPRKMSEHIISKKMLKEMLFTAFFFIMFLFGILQYFKHEEVSSLLDFNIFSFFSGYFDFSIASNALSAYELSLFFSIFVMLQFWNMFNAKAFNTHKSALHNLNKVLGGFGFAALLIIVGQYIIVSIGGSMFQVVPLKTCDWLLIIGGTSFVLWFGELVRLLRG